VMEAVYSNRSIREVLRFGASFLKSVGIEEVTLESEILLRFVLGFEDRARLYIEYERLLNEEEWKRYLALLMERAAKRPIAYIIGEREFYGLPFYINESVLIPRPVTEHLVASVLERIEMSDKPCIDVLDIGTGSGCVGIALAVLDGRVRVVGTDISLEALAVAKKNIKRHKIGARMRLVCCDIAEPFWDGVRFDVVVSNPPYVTKEEYEKVPTDVRYEPSIALYAGEDGLLCYRPLVAQAYFLLKNGGLLALELNPNIAKKVEELVYTAGFSKIQILSDYYGLPRVLLANR